MGKLFLQINVSVDGFIEDEAGQMDWRFVDDEFEAFINDTLASLDAMVFGRRAFELLQQYWPTAAANEGISAHHAAAAAMMNSLPKYVVSTGLSAPSWSNAHVLADLSGVAGLKQRSTRDIALFAGAGIARSAMAAGLVDEYRLIVNPALIAGGIRLFDGGYARANLALADVRRFASGALLLTYRPGELRLD
ncbi:dihydrofolate reductase family protein [Phreatobacter stygius]|nr:dihydrofolate reductase family protein [Phreatobacter stygius]